MTGPYRPREPVYTDLPPEPPEGSVVKFSVPLTFPGNPYTYAALRIGGKWYLTAGSGPHFGPKKWADLVEFACDLLNKSFSIQVVTSWGEPMEGRRG